ncbi:peptidase family m20/M25/M40 domain-containing protein [Phthorimaea operculella]|nr:peptidase family m20/M25/M40 domain-containing protein [Phthorimaea operculella]
MGWFGVVSLVVLGVAATAAQAQDYANNESVKLFTEYVKINTTTHGDLSKAVEFWKARAAEEGLEIKVNEFVKGYPVIVIKWPGEDESLSSIMLNSHMDVVPANLEDGWNYPPFDAHMDEDGVIWGRGTQDMKSVGIQYFEALKRIKAKNVKLLRNVYMTLMPVLRVAETHQGQECEAAEECLHDAYACFQYFEALKRIKTKNVQLLRNVYMTLMPVIDRLMKFREQEYKKYVKNGGIKNAGSYTSVNLNGMTAGTATNVIPGHVSLIFDIRLAIALDETKFDKQLKEWIVSDNVNMTYILKGPQSPATLMTKDDPWWDTFNSTATELGLQLFTIVPPGATDARFIRSKGIPGFGFSPMPNTDQLPHQVNERLSAETFLKGIDIFEKLITNLANVPKDKVSSEPSKYIVRTSRSGYPRKYQFIAKQLLGMASDNLSVGARRERDINQRRGPPRPAKCLRRGTHRALSGY